MGYKKSNLSNIKDAVYKINIEDFEPPGTLWIALYVNAENEIYFDRSGVEHIA